MAAHALFRWLDERFLFVLLFFNLFNALDALTTHIGLSYCGLVEGNVFFAQLLSLSGGYAYLIKIAAFGVFTYVLLHMRWRHRAAGTAGAIRSLSFLLGTTLVCTLALGVVVLSNTAWLLRCGG